MPRTKDVEGSRRRCSLMYCRGMWPEGLRKTAKTLNICMNNPRKLFRRYIQTGISPFSHCGGFIGGCSHGGDTRPLVGDYAVVSTRV